MIGLEDFIKGIHDAVLAANNSLANHNIELLEEYFEDSGQTGALQDSLDAALEATQNMLNTSRPDRDTYLHFKKTLEDAGRALTGGEDPRARTANAKNPQSYTPKTVTVQYARQSEEGLVMHDVSVPLITLVPVSATQIAQAKFKTKLEIQEDNGRLMIGFPSKVPTADQADTPYFTELEIVLEPQKETAGLRKIVEGYEKMLRAQIPH
jgi:hypothetical protein